MTFFIWSGLFSAIANSFIGLYVYSRSPRNPIHRLFAIFSLLVCGWAIGSFLANVIKPEAAALWVLRCNYLFGVWVPSVYVHFIYLASEDLTLSQKIRIKCFYLFSFLLTPFVLTNFFIEKLTYIKGTTFLISEPGFLYYFFFGFFVICAIEVLRYTFLRLKQSPVVGKPSCKYLMLANCLAIFSGLDYFSRVFGVIHFPPIDDFTLVLYVFVLAYAVLRHYLFNAEALAYAVHKDKLAAIGTLAASMNHEIRNPLYVIQGLVETYHALIHEDIHGDKVALIKRLDEALLKIKEQTARAVEIMQNFSSFAKKSTNEKVMISKTSITETINRTLPLVNFELKHGKVKIIVDIKREAEMIQVDQGHLEEILFNLLVNSWQAMKTSGGEIIFSTKELKDKIELKLQDTGPGMTKEQLKTIFEPFYTTKEEGTGLGLYITKQLVERNNGRITVESKVGQGTAFTLSFQKA